MRSRRRPKTVVTTVVGLWGREALAAGDWPDVGCCHRFHPPRVRCVGLSVCRDRNLPLVSGTTGWLNRRCGGGSGSRMQDIQWCGRPTFRWGSTCSERPCGRWKKTGWPRFRAWSITETHHTGKVDAPSGTALALVGDLKARAKRGDSTPSAVRRAFPARTASTGTVRSTASPSSIRPRTERALPKGPSEPQSGCSSPVRLTRFSPWTTFGVDIAPSSTLPR